MSLVGKHTKADMRIEKTLAKCWDPTLHPEVNTIMIKASTVGINTHCIANSQILGTTKGAENGVVMKDGLVGVFSSGR